MVCELERVLRVCNGFSCCMSVTYDGALLLYLNKVIQRMNPFRMNYKNCNNTLIARLRVLAHQIVRLRVLAHQIARLRVLAHQIVRLRVFAHQISEVKT